MVATFSQVLFKRSMKVVDAERAIMESAALQQLVHPYVVALHYTFQGKVTRRFVCVGRRGVEPLVQFI